jgi:hypothetical protein
MDKKVLIEDGEIEVDITNNPGEKIVLTATVRGDDIPLTELHFTTDEFKELVEKVLN